MRARSAVVAFALALVLPASAVAADGTLSKDAPTFGWDGGPGSGHYEPESGFGTYFFGCGAPVPNFYDCEDTVLEVKDKGTLKVAIDAAADDSDLDLWLYRSDAEGEYDIDDEDAYVAAQADESGDESVIVPDLAPGFYVAHVEFYSAFQETYAGTAELSGFLADPPPTPPPVTVSAPPPAAPAPPPPPAQPAAPAAKKPSKRAACLKKARKIKKAKKRKKAIRRCKKLRK